MRIFKFRGVPVEETSYYSGDNKVVFFRYLRDEDKDKCPHCGKPIETTGDIVEGCLLWEQEVEPVETVDKDLLSNLENK